MAKKRENPKEEALARYKAMRDFSRTSEPAGRVQPSETGTLFVVQKHQARRLHYDFRLELDGVLKSWAVPKGPSLDPREKPLAVQTEDHPIDYGAFEGVIPKGEYGAGTVMLWDHGSWEPIGDPRDGLERGDLKFKLHGQKLRGEWAIVRMGGKDNEDGKNWLLIKKKDDESRSMSEFNVLGERSRSVVSGRSLDEIASAPERVWKDGRAQFLESAPSPETTDSPPDVQPGAAVSEAPVDSMPAFIKPQLAVTATTPPAGDQWLHEVKLDGYRLLAHLSDGAVRLWTRNENDWTDRFASVAKALANLAVDSAIIDGEVVVLDENGQPSFGLLQNAMRGRSKAAVHYFAFDLVYLNGHDLRRVPLIDRKGLLRTMLEASNESPIIHYCEHFLEEGATVFEQVASAGLEGIISKRRDAMYESRRSHTWVKVKATHRQEFVVGGYTPPSGSRQGFGALLLGVHTDEGLRYVGRVGTGFTDAELRTLAEHFEEMRVESSPFVNPSADPDYRSVQWVEPVMVVEVEFTEWTRDDLLRHPAYFGIRPDVDPEQVVRDEEALPAALSDPPSSPPKRVTKVVRRPRSPEDIEIEGVRISNPNRTVYPDDGVTKRDVAEYYEAIHEQMLPHVADRPLAVVRCPLGLAGETFYQREPGEGFPDPISGMTIGDDNAIVIRDVQGLLALAQMGVLEIHAWGCRRERTDRPDRVVFDLDPGEGIVWEHVVESARVIRDFLTELGMTTFVKTTGGKGLHLVAPIVRRTGWSDVKKFTLGVATALARLAPLNFVATQRKDLRANRIYIDYLRNQVGATAVAAYSTRARNGATVSTPLHWDELEAATSPKAYTVRTVPDRVTRSDVDPWAGFDDVRQSITRDMIDRVAEIGT